MNMISLKFPPLSRIVLIFLLIFLAAGLRTWPLGALELRLTWVTFYPMVFFAALAGGRFTGGILATILSCVTVYFWSPTGEPWINDAGDWLGVAVFFFNCTIISIVSDRMISSQELAQKLLIQAEKANQSKSIFLANMSHELRTPLNAILGFSQMLNKNPAIPAKEREHITIINNSGEHLLNIINDVLDMSKIEAGQLKLAPEAVDLHKLLQDIIDMIRIRAEKENLTINYKLATDVPRYIQVDPSKLRQIYINLLGNAVKFTDSGSITINIKLIQDADNGSPVMLSEIRDTGRGMKQKEMEHIFNPFEQIDEAVGSREGTGLGLAITKQLLELMNTEIRVESEFGIGTTIWLEQPLEKVSGDVVSKTSAPKQVLGLEDGQQMWRILIVDDALENRQLLSSILEEVGFNVRMAVNGHDAITIFSEWQPHFIWMDRRMPLMGGLEATKTIRGMEGGDKTIIAILTASVMKEQEDESFEAGADASLHKPYKLHEIFSCMEEHLKLKYRYAEPEEIKEGSQSKANGTNGELTKDMLTELSPDLLEELLNAAMGGDSDQLNQLIDSITDNNANLRAPLKNLVTNYRYDRLVELINAATTDG